MVVFMIRLGSVGLMIGLLASACSGLAIAAVHASPLSSGSTPGGSFHVRSLSTIQATSNDYAGYAIMTKAGAVSDVKATWNVPQIAAKCPSSLQHAYFWVGIDGFAGSTLEQIGTATDCSAGSASYHAWYDFFPAFPQTLPMTIAPTNTMHAEVKYSASTHKFTMSISDASTGKSFSISKAVSAAKRASAEWIVEAPLNGTSIYPLTDFGWVVFNNASATISGITHSISGFNNWEITMWNIAATAKKAIPLSTANGGRTFRVNWNSSGP